MYNKLYQIHITEMCTRLLNFVEIT